MKNQEPENKLHEVYRSFMSRELSRPEIQAEKNKFIRSHFSRPVFSFGPEFLVPALALAMLFLYFHHLSGAPMLARIQKLKAKSAVTETSLQLSSTEPAPYGAQPDKPVLPPVIVKRVASREGQPMVYQKVHEGVPITIIWVFTTSGNRP